MVFIGIPSLQAQEKTGLTLNEAINIVLSKSSDVALASAKVTTKKYESESVKNNKYPDLRVSGQYYDLQMPM